MVKVVERLISQKILIYLKNKQNKTIIFEIKIIVLKNLSNDINLILE